MKKGGAGHWGNVFVALIRIISSLGKIDFDHVTQFGLTERVTLL